MRAAALLCCAAACAAAPSPAALRSLYVCDAACQGGLDGARGMLDNWRAVVDAGGAVSDYGGKAGALLVDTLDAYDKATQGVPTFEARLERREELQRFVEGEVRRLHAEQLLEARLKAVKSMRAELLKQLKKSEEVADEKAAEIQRQVEFSFDAAARKLEVPALGLDSSALRAQLSDALAKEAMDVGETPAAKVIALNNAQRSAMKESSRGRSGKRGIAPSLQLVSMLRSNGYGNLQAFLSHAGIGLPALPILGSIPVSFVSGFANDRDDPQATDGGRSPPEFTFQPKLTVDIDL